MTLEETLNEKSYRITNEKHELVPATIEEWGRWFHSPDRIVRRTIINRRKKIFVSTVCLGMDHGVRERKWFESMIFGTSINGACERYATWTEAENGHARMVFRARQARQIRQ